MILPPFDGHATPEGALELMSGLIRAQRPQTVVESGTYMGHGAVCFGDAVRKNGCGHVYTCDPVDNGQESLIYGQNGLFGRVSVFYTGFKEMLNSIRGLIDFAYIDGSGENPPAGPGAPLRWRHFELARARLAPNGIICVHDTAADDWSDGEGGASAQRIRDICQVNFTFQRGLSLYYHG